MYQREHSGSEFLQKIVLLREHGEMPAAFDGRKSFARRTQRIHVGPGQTCRCGVILSSLDHEHRGVEFTPEKLSVKLIKKWNEVLAAHVLSLSPVVDVADRVPGCG